MPVDLLLPAFVIVLTANAILIGIAIRSVRAESRSEQPIVVRSPGRGQRPTAGAADGRADATGRTRSLIADTPRPATPAVRTAPDLIQGGAAGSSTPPGARAPRATRTVPAAATRTVPAAARRSGAADRAAATAGSPPTATARDEEARSAVRRPIDPRPVHETTLAAQASAASADPAEVPTASRPQRPAPAAPASHAVDGVAATSDPTTDGKATSERAARSKTAKAGKAPGDKATATGRRRRFSLPPLDEDQEKVNRSIRSFLAGGPAAVANGARRSRDQDGAPTAESANGHPPTTVAYVAIDCPDARRGASNTQGQPTPAADVAPSQPPIAGAQVPADDEEALGKARAAVEQALRTAARGTDKVERITPDRFRVVLSATGELAARAYLRRTRATVEPVLEALQPPRRLAAATATALGEPVPHAIETAERRLEALLEAGRADDLDMEPRAAGR